MGTIRFSFRTVQKEAMLLYQGTSEVDKEDVQLLVAMVDGK